MSYIGSQLERLGLVIDDRKGTIFSPSKNKVGVQFFLDGKKTNVISIHDGTMVGIFREIKDEEEYYARIKVVRSNRRRGLRRNPEKGPSDYYYKLVKARVPMDHHESDLYVKDTPTSRAILADWPFGRLERFKNNINGEIYIDVPFAYAPYWEKKVRR